MPPGSPPRPKRPNRPVHDLFICPQGAGLQFLSPVLGKTGALMILRILKGLAILLLGALTLFVVSNCTMLGLNYASLDTTNKPAATPAIAASSRQDWRDEAEAIRQAFQADVYGPWPDGLAVSVGATRIADPAYLGGKAVLEETQLTLGTGAGARTFNLAIAWPAGVDRFGPVPVLIGQTFVDNCLFYASTALTAPSGEPCQRTDITGMAGTLLKGIFGEYIATLPMERFIDRGYAVANFYASELVPDRNGEAQAALAALRESDGIASTGAIAVWAYGFTAVIDALQRDRRADLSRIAVWGHSRHAKSALLAAAFDTRIALVIAHQSGFGGAALSRSGVGEGIARMTGAKGGFPPGYPYWFDPSFSGFAADPSALPVDQHQLLALIAPRAVFLGNGRRDVWSDPNSTWRAAEAASRIWEMEGRAGLRATDMLQFRPEDGIAYFLRSGGHGIIETDIDAFLAELDAQFADPLAGPAARASK